MRTKNLFLTSIMFGLLIMTSCSDKLLMESDNGSSQNYSVGAIFEVQLQGNPERGFVWRKIGIHDEVVQQLGEPEIKTAAESGDDFGTYTFKFKVTTPGNTQLRMMYYDKNAEDPVPKGEFMLTIISSK